MDYCTKWQLVGLAIGFTPILTALALTAMVARWPRRAWVALLLGPIVGAAVLILSHPWTLVLWNGIRPAICNGM